MEEVHKHLRGTSRRGNARLLGIAFICAVLFLTLSVMTEGILAAEISIRVTASYAPTKLQFQRTETVTIRGYVRYSDGTPFTAGGGRFVTAKITVGSTILASLDLTPTTSAGLWVQDYKFKIPDPTGRVVITVTAVDSSGRSSTDQVAIPQLTPAPLNHTIIIEKEVYTRIENLNLRTRIKFPDGTIFTVGRAYAALTSGGRVVANISLRYDAGNMAWSTIPSYQILANAPLGNWTASFSAADNYNNYGRSGNATINVLPAVLNVGVSTEKPAYEKTTNLKILSTVRYSNNTIVRTGTAVASLTYAGQFIRNVTLSFDSGSLKWTGTYRIMPNNPAGNWTIDIFARDRYANTGIGTGTVIVHSMNLTVTVTTDRTTYERSQTIKIRTIADYPTGAEVAVGNLTALLSIDNVTITVVPLSFNITNTRWEGNYAIARGDPVGQWKILVNVDDYAGDYGTGQAAIQVITTNLRVAFNLGIGYNRFETMNITANVTYVGGAPVDIGAFQAYVTTFSRNFTIPMTYDATTTNWRGQYTVKVDDQLGLWRVNVTGFDPYGNTGYKQLLTSITPSRGLTMVLLSSTKQGVGVGIELRVKVTYPDGSPVASGSVSANLDGGNHTLTYNSATQAWRTTLPARGAVGTYPVTVSAVDQHSNTGTPALFTIQISNRLQTTLRIEQTAYKKTETITAEADIFYPDGVTPTTRGTATLRVEGTGISTPITLTYDSSTRKWKGTYKILVSDPSGIWAATLSVEDGAGNSGATADPIYLTVAANSLTIRLTNPSQYFALEPNTPMQLASTVGYSDGTTMSVGSAAAEVITIFGQGQTVTLAYDSTKGWAGSLALPTEAPTGRYVIVVRATDTFGNNGILNTDTAVVKLTSAITPERTEPRNPVSLKLTISGAVPANVTVEVFYPNGTLLSANPMQNNGSSWLLTIPGNQTSVLGEYIANYRIGNTTYQDRFVIRERPLFPEIYVNIPMPIALATATSAGVGLYLERKPVSSALRRIRLPRRHR